MTVKLQNSKIHGELSAIPSKSYAHRIAICNFLAGSAPVGDCGDFTSKDITATERCLSAVKNGETIVDCGESGSTLRFLLPLFASLGGKYSFVGHGKLMERPNEELFGVMKEHGVTTEKTDRINTSGKLTSGEYKIRGDISSQYISGLLMALPTLDGDSEITLTTPLVSASYVDITLEVLSLYGVKIKKKQNGYVILGNQTYKGRVKPEGDWSNSAFFLVLGAINDGITMTGLNENSVQGDRAIVDIIRKAGALVEFDNNKITVKKQKLNGFSFDAENCPDLVPVASVLGACAKGVTVINNVERLKIKESDRIESTIKMLGSFGIRAESDGKSLWVYGGQPNGGIVDGYNDHRIVMSASVLASVAKGESVITGANAVEKSYPTFFNDYKSVGGIVQDDD